jgi:hypothetical protein
MHGLALARSIDAAEYDDEGERGPLQRALEIQQLPAQFRDFELLLLFLDPATHIGGLEHGDRSSDAVSLHRRAPGPEYHGAP